MPNWTRNILMMSGDSETIKQIYGDMSNNGKTQFDFNAIAPIPQELVDTEAPPKTDTVEQIERNKYLESKYGYNNWYDWQCANWGTKWNASDVKWTDDEIPCEVIFLTAWSPPIALISKLAMKYPSVMFDIKYIGEGCDFVGNMVYENGGVVTEFNPEWYSNDGIALRDSMGEYSYNDEYEIEGRIDYIKNHPDDAYDGELDDLKAALEDKRGNEGESD
jgi:hypothetical protein